MNGKCLIGCNVSKQHMNKLIDFFTVHQALSRELSEAKPLGICKTITSGRNPTKLNNHTKLVQTHLRPNSKSITQSKKGSKVI